MRPGNAPAKTNKKKVLNVPSSVIELGFFNRLSLHPELICTKKIEIRYLLFTQTPAYASSTTGNSGNREAYPEATYHMQLELGIPA
ncbi:hypothetical protein FHS27_004749 [Rhodopirellula rubra]|uniref:Uncharacterized protein n=1 Tax=Aporhodopirellula rubra TaxID=980271 RepID=A0A7W5H8C4_9BACT|nr:hypothetical protein [Aporhodopirellula rubra]